MKKYIAFAIVVAVVMMFLAGCAQQESAPAPVKKSEPAKTVASSPSEPAEPAKTTTTTTTKTEPAPAPAKQMSKSMQELLQKNVGRVKSLKYMYQDQTNKPEEWETWVKGDKMHVKLREMDNVKEDVYIDNIYMDLSTSTAKGFCERSVYRCADPNSPVDVKFAKYYRKTPLEWLQEVTYAEKVAEEQMQQRTVWKIQYTEGDTTVTMWIDEYYGVPVMVKEQKGSAVNDYIFEDISFNAVEDKDLDHAYVDKSYN